MVPIIEFETELQENVSVEELKRQYRDGVIVWISGSGCTPEGKNGKYRAVLEYRGITKYLEREIADATANQVMISGITDAVRCLEKPVSVYVIAPTALGFASGSRGKGTNAGYFRELFELITAKNCKLTEVQFLNGSDAVKKYIFSVNPDKREQQTLEQKTMQKQRRYKEMIYRECIAKVTAILRKHDTDPSLIREITELRP